jgi:glycosyltransferase involved in cell wall biosynthesis
MMRIAYVHYLDASDTALNHVRQFVDAARALGHDVGVHAMNLAPSAEERAEGQGWMQARRALQRRLGRWLHEPKELAWNVRYVQRELAVLADARPDVLLVRDDVLNASCVPVARRLGLPLVLEVNAPVAELELYRDDYWHVPWVGPRMEGWKLRRAQMVTVVSSALRDHLAAQHGLGADRFAVVPNGADVGRFRPDVPRDPALDAAGGPVVGFVGSFDRWHGTDLLAHMMLEVARLRPAVRFVLVGDGPGLPAVREAVAPLDGRVLFTGKVPHDRVPGLVAAFDAGVAPDSGFYMSPLKVIEWMAAGIAVVAPAHDPLREVIDDGVHGLLFEPGCPDGFVASVLRVVDDAALRRSLGVAAAARVRASLTWEENARRVLAACARARTMLETAAPAAEDCR